MDLALDATMATMVDWDQASVPAPVGLLDPDGIPVVGAEQAAKLIDLSGNDVATPGFDRAAARSAMTGGWRDRFMAPVYALVISFVLVVILGVALNDQMRITFTIPIGELKNRKTSMSWSGPLTTARTWPCSSPSPAACHMFLLV